MPFVAGVYTIPVTSWYPAVPDTEIDPDDSNSTNADFATAFNLTFLRDGSAVATANFPMGNHKLTGLAAGTTNGDSVRYEQLTALSGVYQPLDATLTALAGLSTTASTYIRCTGTDTFTLDSYATVLSNIVAAGLGSNSFTGVQATTTAFRGPNGSAGAPGLSSTGETNSGMFFGDDGLAAYVAISAAGVEQVRFNGTGPVAQFTAPVQAAVAVSSETSGTLSALSRNRQVNLTGNVTLGNSVFTENDKMVFDPGTSNRTFTRGSGVTMYVNGVDSATATLAANQMGGAHYRSASVVVLSGAMT